MPGRATIPGLQQLMRVKMLILRSFLLGLLLVLLFAPGARARECPGYGCGYGAPSPSRGQHALRVPRYTGLGSSLPGRCPEVARTPCGCYAQARIFGTTERIHEGLNLWRAAVWRRAFARVSPSPGTVAVWPGGGHVARVVDAVAHAVDDSWNHFHVISAGTWSRLTFHDPHRRVSRTSYL